MLRLGFKNEEKEMLSRTINELQELRAELSVLKDKLVMIIPEDKVISMAENSEEMETKQSLEEEEVIEDIPEGCDLYDETSCFEEEITELETINIMEDDAVNFRSMGDITIIDDMMVESSKKDWAVVNYGEIKRPWWKFGFR